MKRVLSSKNVLINEAFIPADIVIEDGIITKIEKYKTQGNSLDVEEKKVVPGFVDLHSDAIEREIEPRPNAIFPIKSAIIDLDKKLSMSGITTMFHAIGFEENLKKRRTVEFAIEIIEEIYNANKKYLSIDNLIHARFELSACDAIEPIKECIIKGMINLLSLMDHTPGQGQFRSLESFHHYYGKHYDLNEEEIKSVIYKKLNKDEKAIKNLIDFARKNHITLLSHDDDCVEKLDGLVEFGVGISEFPLSLEVAKYAVSKGIATGMGAPNIVRGGSQSGNIAAIDLVKEDVCRYLCSDYHPTSMLQAVYKINEASSIPLSRAFSMISKIPAKYANLHDRGVISEGKIADLVVIDDTYLPKVVFTMKNGKLIYCGLDNFSKRVIND